HSGDPMRPERVFCLLCMATLTPANSGTYGTTDRDIVEQLQAGGARYQTDWVLLWFEPGVLSAREMQSFAGLVNKGIKEIERYLSVTRPPGRKIAFFVSGETKISHARQDCVF